MAGKQKQATKPRPKLSSEGGRFIRRKDGTLVRGRRTAAAHREGREEAPGSAHDGLAGQTRRDGRFRASPRYLGTAVSGAQSRRREGLTPTSAFRRRQSLPQWREWGRDSVVAVVGQNALGNHFPRLLRGRLRIVRFWPKNSASRRLADPTPPGTPASN